MITIRLDKRNKTIVIVNKEGQLRLSKQSKTVKVVNRRQNIVVKRAGKIGPQGPAGTVQVAGTVTTEPGTDAIVENYGTPQAALLNFFIPRGEKGDTGTSNFLRVHHYDDPSVERPDAFAVEWVGTVAPANATVDDTWIHVLQN